MFKLLQILKAIAHGAISAITLHFLAFLALITVEFAAHQIGHLIGIVLYQMAMH
ncbi:hypothetical protein [uncultured Roseibium sp.]|uniref:hypothetical protein n=1 Tax=uncultured Roseibium sp. TaxID=1936171 RepID=UPI002628F53A|nr:hypothetical protein [uncultured Roseibium sp.]